MVGPRVLLVLGASAGWSRGILRGFSAFAHEQGWNLLHYNPALTELGWLADTWNPAAVVLGPVVEGPWPAALRASIRVSVNADRAAEGVASVFLDEKQIATEVFKHFLSAALPHVTTFRFDPSAFAVAREAAFRDLTAAAGVRLAAGWWLDGAKPSRANEDPAALAAWLRHLPKPCGVFACCDAWATVVARYARLSELRVPEDISIVGVDNDTIECELSVPPLSSVIVPWPSVGRQAAELVCLALAGKSISGQRIIVKPGHVMARRSSDVFAIDDAIVARAVRWIHEHSSGPVMVPAVARAVAASRRRLERRFHAVLGRTIADEIRRARVETAKRLLAGTAHGLAEVARMSGLTSAALLNVAFRRELGLPPGAYRRRVREEPDDD